MKPNHHRKRLNSSWK